MNPIVVVAHNVRSALNVGAIFRSMACFGVDELVCSGYTPYPQLPKDARLPHEAEKVTKSIAKTALGSEELVKFSHIKNLGDYLARQKQAGWLVAALEQTPASQAISNFKVTRPMILIVGNEVEGVEKSILKLVDVVLEIPMFGKKESLNVASATAIALYELTRSAIINRKA